MFVGIQGYNALLSLARTDDGSLISAKSSRSSRSNTSSSSSSNTHKSTWLQVLQESATGPAPQQLRATSCPKNNHAIIRRTCTYVLDVMMRCTSTYRSSVLCSDSNREHGVRVQGHAEAIQKAVQKLQTSKLLSCSSTKTCDTRKHYYFFASFHDRKSQQHQTSKKHQKQKPPCLSLKMHITPALSSHERSTASRQASTPTKRRRRRERERPLASR